LFLEKEIICNSATLYRDQSFPTETLDGPSCSAVSIELKARYQSWSQSFNIFIAATIQCQARAHQTILSSREPGPKFRI